MYMKGLRATALVAGLLTPLAACGSSSTTSGTSAAQPLKGVKIEVAAKWTGVEQDNFLKIAKIFEGQTGAKITYTATGDSLDTFLAPRIQGGDPPDIAVLPQPGLVAQYAGQHALKPLAADVVAAVDQNFTPYWKNLGSSGGTPYGVLIKAAYKSTMWYSAKAFDTAGIQPPQTWADMVGPAAQKLRDSGVKAPFSLCGASGWTLTDWFENVYLSQAGPQMYDKLAAHQIKWTDPSVAAALKSLGQAWQPNQIAPGALQTDYPTCVGTVFGKKQAAMVYESDFVGTEMSKYPGADQDAKVFPFPKVGATQPVELGGDIAVVMKDTKGAQALLKFLASAEAGKAWAALPGYFSANKNVPPTAYTDAIHQQLAKTILTVGDAARYDMSDMAPAAFGGTDGKGEWKDLTDFLRNPADVAGTQQKLEADAAAAFK